MTAKNPGRRNGERTTPATEKLDSLARAYLYESIERLIDAIVATKSSKGTVVRQKSKAEKEFANVYIRLQNLANALTAWHCSDQFLTPAGMPKALTKSGRESIIALAESVTETPVEAKQVLDDMLHLALLTKTSNGYLPKERSLILGKSKVLDLAYGATAVARLARTISENFEGRSPALYERQVSEVFISEEDLPLFLRFAEQQGQYLIDAVDDWLERRRCHGKSTSRRIAVGLGAYAWAHHDSRPTDSRVQEARAGLPRR